MLALEFAHLHSWRLRLLLVSDLLMALMGQLLIVTLGQCFGTTVDGYGSVDDGIDSGHGP